ncbi:MAG: phosphoribosylformylglycinamidine synthase subunit PurQ [Nitrospira sp.]|nr:phosphoribosylformylglycinamidine synthase subunit PurQ [Nitrospira sp.]HNP27668.1 phosphoribosylformylglycinamidine synthase subunit PurQ [Nitrospirales bacterium]
MNFGIIVFPGSNCDRDCAHVLSEVMGQTAHFIWHQERSVKGLDAIILPGGFSYGDYLRTGAIARFSPIMEAIVEFVGRGGMVLGICNGFQMLLELGLLPGAMLRNRDLSFICEDRYIRVENADTPFTNQYEPGQILRLPIAHAEGNYYTNPVTLSALQANAQIVFRYCDREGRVTSQTNPNGSLDNIAGIRNAAGNVLGLMPHPERAAEPLLHNEDGVCLFRSMISALIKHKTPQPV